MRALAAVLPRALVAAVVAVGGLVVLHTVLDFDLGLRASLWESLYTGTIVAAGVACVVGGRRGERIPWALIGIGIVLWGGGQLYWQLALSEVDPAPFPSIADALWLSVYPPMYAGLLLLLRARRYRVSGSLLLDGLIGALAVVALVTAIILEPVAGAGSGTMLAVVTNLAYPVADTLLLAVVAVAFALRGWRIDLSWGLVGAGLSVFAVTDAVYAFQIAQDSYSVGGLVDIGWTIAIVILAVAGFAPVSRARDVRPGLPILAVPVVFAAIALGVLVWDHYWPVLLVSLCAASSCILLVVVRMGLTYRENLTLLDERTHQAETDPLTGLANRRRLMPDLDRCLERDSETIVAIFDLNGFKNYNDAFGHPAGDTLLRRLARSLAARFDGRGTAYRMGGDEFCVVVELRGADPAALVALAVDALSEEGEGFRITAAAGHVVLPTDALDAVEALRLADHRMYTNKNSGRATSGEQSMSVLLAAQLERTPELGDHLDDVAELAVQLARSLGVIEEDVATIRIAAVLHDIGKIAVPEAILTKPGPLDAEEWEFIHRHTLAGETIMQAAPSLRASSELVRSTHERWDGSGYPDQLSGEGIPLGARIIAVCDAFDAMLARRPYSASLSSAAALAELVRHAGFQFDPKVVEAFCAVLAARSACPERTDVAAAA